MNLSLYSINAFIVLDTEGHRVLAKYYRPKGHPQGESKELLTLKDQKAFEKGLWQKTKKAGGTTVSFHQEEQCTDIKRRGHHPIRIQARRVQAFSRPHYLLHCWAHGERAHAFGGPEFPHRRAVAVAEEPTRKEGRVGEPGYGIAVSRRDD